MLHVALRQTHPDLVTSLGTIRSNLATYCSNLSSGVPPLWSDTPAHRLVHNVRAPLGCSDGCVAMTTAANPTKPCAWSCTIMLGKRS
jgi:hypothetical protein